MTRPLSVTRRSFLSKAAALSVAGPAAPFALSLASMGEAAAQSVSCTDYKALVCLFLVGGNDAFNTVLATDTPSWDAYVAARNVLPSPIALPPSGFSGGVLPISPITPIAGRSFALHPELTHLKTMFEVDRRAAIIANVGPLVRPTSIAEYRNSAHPKPRKLFSHNDQQSMWQSFSPEGSTQGWGGRVMDLLASCNSSATFASISSGGNVVWLSGRNTRQYQLSANGALRINAARGTLYGSTTASDTLRTLATDPREHLIMREQAAVYARTLSTSDDLISALSTGAAASIPAPTNWVPAGASGAGTSNPVANSLRMVARMIAARETLGLRRQVFFVPIGGFDTHDGQLPAHATLLGRMSHAMKYFQDQMAALGLADKVTTFTASDFGRTLSSNGDGTDHGWGGHHFVVGGAVNGGRIYGTFPEIGLGTATDVGRGSLLPTTGVDQYAGMLARWFGVPNGALADLFPNLPNFVTGNDFGLPASLRFVG
jgi:uncharacterized protein (DUF1501 family)